ncbi:sensor histidine kinase [Demequina sp. NBRC 110051]|uniref:sensor histidine kinase n=1 Tax=Demequina sp. NBRC 110051 TaxID=1570340 RepID=UPI0009FE4D29|nr:ATP-binding protein [Demequina sp. NBRC 110051]
MTGTLDHSARDRVQRMLYMATGIAAAVFGLLMLSGSSGILASLTQMAPWYTALSLLVVVGLQVAIGATAFVLPLTTLHRMATVAVVGFLVVQVLWVPAMQVDVLANDGEPWLQGVNAIASTLAGVRWRTRWVWAFPVLQGLLVPIIQLQTSERTLLDAGLDGLGSVLFCSIVTGMAFSAVQAADRQDRAARDTRALASIEAARRTREREEARINGIVHDDVMSVLLTASRDASPAQVAGSAREAIAAVQQISRPASAREGGYGAAEVIAALRSVPADGAIPVAVHHSVGDCPTVPADAVEALVEAVGEALRNVARHAGVDAAVTLTLRADHDGVMAEVADTGHGFDTSAVDPLRLGLRISIEERMAAVPDGSARVESAPGRGTTVTLAWSPS